MRLLIEKIIDILSSNGQTVSFAESCTGGRIAKEFTSVAGVSAILNGSCITYSNSIKSLWLGVKEETLRDFGAVSSECVYEMLDGIKQMASSDYAVAVSGIAGPDGATEFKPVGTVYIGVLTPKGSIVNLYNFTGDRDEVQKEATRVAIENLLKAVDLR